VAKVDLVLPCSGAATAVMVQPRLPGWNAQTVVAELAKTDPARAIQIERAVSEQLGRHLRAVHTIPQEEIERRLGPLFLRGTRQVSRAWRSPEWDRPGRILDLRQLATTPPLTDEQRASMEAAAEQMESTPSELAVVHRDLALRNALIDRDHQVTGIIDWDFVDVAPRLTEFAKLRACYSKEKLDAFLAGYGGELAASPRVVDALAAIQCLPHLWFAPSHGSESAMEPIRTLLSR
jgi:Ser/Thr protein kinase RdoA (MazF antagonist)